MFDLDFNQLENGFDAVFRLDDGNYVAVKESLHTPIPTMSISEGYPNVSLITMNESDSDINHAITREIFGSLSENDLQEVIDDIECNIEVNTYEDDSTYYVTIESKDASEEYEYDVDEVSDLDEAIEKAKDEFMDSVRDDIKSEYFNMFDYINIVEHPFYYKSVEAGDDSFAMIIPATAKEAKDQLDVAVHDYDAFLRDEILECYQYDSTGAMISNPLSPEIIYGFEVSEDSFLDKYNAEITDFAGYTNDPKSIIIMDNRLKKKAQEREL